MSTLPNNGYVWNAQTGAWEFPAAQVSPPPPPPPPSAQTLGAQAGYAPPPPPPGPQAAPAYVPRATTEVGNPARMKTGLVRFSYFYVLQRDKDNVQRCTLLIPKTDIATYNALRGAEHAGLIAKWATPPKFWISSIKDGDTATQKNGAPLGDECRGHWVINAKGSPKALVRVLDQYGSEISDPRGVKSGDFGRASITFYGSDKDNNIGVFVALNSIVFMREGESLGGGFIDAEDEFAEDFVKPPVGYVPPTTYSPAAPPQQPPPPPPGYGAPQQPPQTAPGFAPPPPSPPGYGAPQQPPPPPPAAPMQPAPPAPPAPVWDGTKWVYP